MHFKKRESAIKQHPLDPDVLIRSAFEARKFAYAPYSSFQVGAAILSENGRVYTGCNVENISFGLTICAERVALFNAISAGEKHFQAIALIADTEHPVSPCGACRQALTEFEPDLLVVMSNTKFEKKILRLSQLLPEKFLIARSAKQVGKKNKY